MFHVRFLPAKPIMVLVAFSEVVNPAYNKDRGPAKFVGARFHVEL
jgi:hypothetical protein